MPLCDKQKNQNVGRVVRRVQAEGKTPATHGVVGSVFDQLIEDASCPPWLENGVPLIALLAIALIIILNLLNMFGII